MIDLAYEWGVIAFAVALVAALVGGPPAIAWLRRGGFGGSVREDTPESHQRKLGTPSMGGIFLVPAILAGTLAGGRGDRVALGVAGAVLCFALVGSIDDIAKARRRSGRGIMARTKFAAQILVSIGVAAYAHFVLRRPGEVSYCPVMAPLALGLGGLLVWALWAVWCTNATNITDGLDGLATGLTFLCAIPFLVRCVLRWDVGGTAASAALMGACLGFLVYNRRPAKVWMGDTGSLGLGGGLVALSVYTGAEWLLLVAGLPFMLEALSVVIQVAVFQTTKRIRKTPEGRRFFRKAPLHHHFEEGGTPESRVVLGFWALGVLCAAAGVALVGLEQGV
jgi:phospho-N-acetylmuramoyl-pentapeptide-transferase